MKRRIQERPTIMALVGFAVLCILALTLYAYRPALDAPFVFDDIPNIQNSPAIRWTELSWENVTALADSSRLQSRPVANLSFALNHLFAGPEPGGFHFANVLIHLLVGAALLWVCVLYGRNADRADGMLVSTWCLVGLALLPVALFLLHPLNTQAVTYVVQRMTSLAALFTLLAFASYLVARHGGTTRCRWSYVAALAFWVLGVGSKENSALLLPLIALYEICFFRDFWKGKAETAFGGTWTRQWTIRTWVGFSAVSALILWILVAKTNVFGLTGEFPSRDFNGIERLLTQARVQVYHLSQLVWPAPDRLNLDHDVAVSRGLFQPATTFPALLLCTALLVVAVSLAWHKPRYGFPLLAYALLHSLEAGPVNLELMFEHRMYVPMTMLTVGAAAIFIDADRRRRTTTLVAMFLFLLVLAGWTHERNRVWADPLEFRKDIAAKSPYKARAQSNYALTLHEAGSSEAALPVIRRAVELDNDDPRLLLVLGEILVDLGQPAEAANVFRTAIRMDPTNVKFALGLGTALAAAGDEDMAFQHYLVAGEHFGRNGRPWEAIMVLKEAVGLRSNDAMAHNALGNAYVTAGLESQAVEEFRTAIELDPLRIEAWYNLGLVADRLERRDEAVSAYQGFLERAPPSLQQQVRRARERVDYLTNDTAR